LKNTTCACTLADRHKNKIKEKMNQTLEKKLCNTGAALAAWSVARDNGASLWSLM
jgi:hypothetical protein